MTNRQKLEVSGASLAEVLKSNKSPLALIVETHQEVLESLCQAPPSALKANRTKGTKGTKRKPSPSTPAGKEPSPESEPKAE
jgi:hypothetical protein